MYIYNVYIIYEVYMFGINGFLYFKDQPLPKYTCILTITIVYVYYNMWVFIL